MNLLKEAIKKTVETYNKFAKIYADRYHSKVLQYQLNIFVSMLSGKKILDVGCGSGRDVAYFLEEGLEPLGIDISDGLLEEAKKRVPKGNFMKMDMLSLKFDKESFDGIVALDSFLHIPKAEGKKVLANFFKILKPNGPLYLCVKEGEGESFIERKEHDNNQRFFAFYKQVELEELLKSIGFKIVEVINDDTDSEGRSWIEIFAKKEVR